MYLTISCTLHQHMRAHACVYLWLAVHQTCTDATSPGAKRALLEQRYKARALATELHVRVCVSVCRDGKPRASERVPLNNSKNNFERGQVRFFTDASLPISVTEGHTDDHSAAHEDICVCVYMSVCNYTG